MLAFDWNKNTMKIALTVVAVAGVAMSMAQTQTAPPRTGTAESSLLGISLYTSGLNIISKYGSPDEIQALTLGSGPGTTSNGASGGGRGGPSGGSSQGAGATQVIENMRPGDMVGNPFDPSLDTENWRQTAPGGGGGGQTRQPPGAGGAGGGSGPGGGGATGDPNRIEITRWVYKRASSRYAFILDKYTRVIQIEAIGMDDSRPRTRRGVAFGSTFARIMNIYREPDAYEINGDTIVVRFLVKDHVAFRMQKLRQDSPHVVTGIVVAAGKE
jgi:hypothetical protein